jgi:prepilin-type N-terminal cleavage/methylation domain-containing protein
MPIDTHVRSVRTVVEPMKNNPGFTLVELIVVIALIGIILFITVPKFQQNIFQDDPQKAVRRIMETAGYLKEQALKEQKRYALHMDCDENRFWVSHEGMSETDIQRSMRSGFSLPGKLKVTPLLKKPFDPGAGARIVTIRFYKEGYVDPAVFYVDDLSGNLLKVKIEPFLPQVAVLEDD